MKTTCHFCAIGLLLLIAGLINPAYADGYGFPITNPYAATVVGTPPELRPPLLPFREISNRRIESTVFDDRPPPDLLWFNAHLRSGLLYQEGKTAPLIFIVAGTGGSYRSTRIRSMANYFYQAGFHVVTLSSPTHPNFITAASSTQYPGSLRDDSKDLYRVMEIIWKSIQNQIQVSEFYLTGYSLGGTQAAFISKLDEQKKVFNFRKVLMINPAVNLYNSVKILDDMLARNLPGGVAELNKLLTELTDSLVTVFREQDIIGFGENFTGTDMLYLVYQRLDLDNQRLAALIGASFRLSVASLVFTTDVVTNAGYIKPKNLILYPTDSLTDFYIVAQQTSFLDYYHDLYLPYFLARQPGATEETIIFDAGLQSIEDYLKTAGKIGAVTNADEIILAPGELDYLRKLFGPRIRIFPYGGHCGNMDYKENVAHMLNFFKN